MFFFLIYSNLKQLKWKSCTLKYTKKESIDDGAYSVIFVNSTQKEESNMKRDELADDAVLHCGWDS